jgi:hypothetical protein
MRRIIRSSALLAALALASTPAGTQYVQTLPAYDAPHGAGTVPGVHFTVGVFDGIPSGTIATATVSGFFEDVDVGSTTPVQIFLGALEVARCDVATPCDRLRGGAAWTYWFLPVEFGALTGPTATLTVTQGRGAEVHLGATTLTITYARTGPLEPQDPKDPKDPDPGIPDFEPPIPGDEIPQSTVPEPGTLALLATGLLGIAGLVRGGRRA